MTNQQQPEGFNQQSPQQQHNQYQPPQPQQQQYNQYPQQHPQQQYNQYQPQQQWQQPNQQYGQYPPQQQAPQQNSGRARATFGISALLAGFALMIALTGNSSETPIAMLAFIGFSIVAAASYFASKK